MKKKVYTKPEVNYTEIDYSITLTLSSQDSVGPPPDNGCPDGEICFTNPFKWFK